MLGVFLACSLPSKESRHAWSLFGLFTTFEGVKACLSLFGLFTTFEGVKACLESFWPVHYLRRSQGMLGVFLACSLPSKESRHA